MITVGVVAAALAMSVVIGVLMKNSKKTRMSQLDVSKKQSARKSTGVSEPKEDDPFATDGKRKNDSTIGDAIKKEREMLKESEKGGYVGGVGPSKKRKNEGPSFDGPVSPESDEDFASTARQRKGRPGIYNDSAEMGDNRSFAEGDKEQARRKAWEYMYARKVSGGFINSVQQASVGSKEAGGAEKPGQAGPGPKVQYYRPYHAVVDRTFTSADTKATFVATGSEVPVKGWKIIGKASPSFTDNRFHVEITGVLSLENVHYTMKGYAASVDQSDGIISKVRHDDVAGTMTSSVLSGMSSFLNALRRDTTTVEVTSGTTVTGQTKVDDRGREAGLAAGDTMFQGLAKKAESSAKKTPTLIMEKGVPVLVYFTP